MLLLGKQTMLFKIYPGEPVPKKLPKEFQGTFLGGYFDRSFFLVFLFFLISYLFLIYSFSQVKPRNIIGLEKIPGRFARLIMDSPAYTKQSVENKVVVQESRQADGETENKKNISSGELKKKTARVGGGNAVDIIGIIG
jgi:hypothetical protein